MSILGGPSKAITARLANLEEHLRREHPMLLDVVPTYCKFDRLLYRIGLLSPDDSLAARIPWWPLIAVLGTFSSGKSTFINGFLGERLQSTGTQAVDDKFTVICFGPESERHVLPGTALDADPRFPFHGMSGEIDKVAAGEGKRIDSYLQLKTTPSAAVKGKILIDSPGFDADDQRRSTLRLTDHIADLADLVLILFDARHPEPGAMQDTLEHLVADTVHRPDASKFLYILNQIDVTAREDNPEEVVAAWQRAVAQAGLTSGPFYCIYDEKAAVPIEEPALRERFSTKRDKDMRGILGRMEAVEVERSYRIISMLETVSNELEGEVIPALTAALRRWRKRTLILDGVGLGLVVALLVGIGFLLGPGIFADVWTWLLGLAPFHLIVLIGVAVLAFAGHFWARILASRAVARTLPEAVGQMDLNLRRAFLKSSGHLRSIYRPEPAGWSRRARKRLKDIRTAVSAHVQKLNDIYTDPSGRQSEPPAAPIEDETPAPEPVPDEGEVLIAEEARARTESRDAAPAG